ncbi:hypothetical protein [Streptomyces sp. NPDC094032]|uniref:hypothetical protein n=1 Tax=Streptomyces sp. NPDC094032 TaxID=3155308 RepID=UPI0033243C21
MDLLPTVPNRIANASLGVVPSVAFVLQASEAGWALAAALACLPLAVRGWRMGVRCEQGHLVVRGLVWSRRIERGRITGLTDFPAVRWIDRGGRRRWTPVLALVRASGEPASADDRKRENEARLRRWVAGRRRRR